MAGNENARPSPPTVQAPQPPPSFPTNRVVKDIGDGNVKK
jgi:hypothetical protein